MTKPGYEIGRDDEGLTDRERSVLAWLHSERPRPSYTTMGERMGVTRQRVSAIVKALEEKGYIVRRDGDLYVKT